jgi:hypothetical protein
VFDDKVTLIAIFVGLYLFDCVIFLSPGQALARFDLSLTKKARHKPGWRIAGLDFGLTFYPMRGYFPAFLNPFTPFVAVFKSARLLQSRSGQAAAALPLHRIMHAAFSMRLMSGFLAIQAILMFGLLPYLLLTGGSGMLLIGVLFAFLLAAVIIALSYPIARALKLGKAHYWSLAAQSLICIPMSLNFPRKLLLARAADATASSLLDRVQPDRQPPIRREFVTVLQYATQGGAESDDMEIARSLLEKLKSESDE